MALPSNPSRWLRADAGLVCADAPGRLSTWQDQSGHDRHATQTSLANQPYVDATPGDPCIQFSDSMNSATGALSVTGSVNGQAYSAFAVADSYLPLIDVIHCTTGNGTGTFGWGSTPSKVWCRVASSDIISPIPHCCGISLVGMVLSPSNARLYQNHENWTYGSPLPVGPTAQNEIGRWTGVTTSRIGIREIIEFDRTLTDAEIADTVAHFMGKYALQPFTDNYVFVGDSTTYGNNSTRNGNLLRYVKASGLPRGYNTVNDGHPNYTWANLASVLSATNGFKLAGKFNALIVRMGINDLRVGRTPAQAAADAAAYCATARAAGWVVWLSTISHSDVALSLTLDYNQRLRDLVAAGGADGLIDVAREPVLLDSHNPAYFDAAHIHPNNAGYQLMAAQTVRDLSRLRYRSVTTPGGAFRAARPSATLGAGAFLRALA